MPRMHLLPLLVVVTTVGGCARYVEPYAFEPHPAEVLATTPGSADAEPVRTLVSILDIHRPDQSDDQARAEMLVRLRIENTSPFPVTVDPGSLVLFSGGLVRFPDPIVDPDEPVDAGPGESVALDARFSFPGDGTPEGTDLSGLNLRWTLVIDGQSVTNSATFERQMPDAYYYYPRHGVGVGYQRYPY